jgi:hypothetical protein
MKAVKRLTKPTSIFIFFLNYFLAKGKLGQLTESPADDHAV